MLPPSPPGTEIQTLPTPSSPNASLSTTNTTKSQPRRRRRKDNDDEKPIEGIPKLDFSQSSYPFACPFYLHDRQEWHSCLRNYTLNRIVDVRLHILRVHMLAPQCPVCGQEFNDDSAQSESAEERCNKHLELRACQPLPFPPPARHGLTRYQADSLREIASRRRRRMPYHAVEKWFEMWDVIFPGSTRPDLPYIIDHPDVQRIRDMNDDILAGDKWRELTAPTSGSSSSLQNVSRETVVTITERLLASYRRMYQRDSGHVAPASEEISLASGQTRVEERANDRPKRQSMSSMGKRTMSERSDSDHEDVRECLDFDQAGSSARRLKRRVGDRRSLIFQDPPPKIDELDEPPEELGDSEVLAKELPFYAYTTMEVESP